MSTEKIVISFVLSDAALAKAFVSTGKRPSPIQSTEATPEQATPEQREALLAGYPYALAEMFRVGTARIDLLDYERTDIHGQAARREFDAAPPADEALALAIEQISARAAHEATKEAKRLADEDARKAEQARKEAEAKAEDAAREAADAAKVRWIAAHGSDHLKRACARGHDCGRLYTIERAAAELPGYTVDFEDAALWKPRACPSVAALDEAERVEHLDLRPADEIEVRIVWLTAAAQDERDESPYPDEFEECEAVVVRGYLGKYDLVRQM